MFKKICSALILSLCLMVIIPIIMPQSIVATEAATTVKLKKSSLNLYTGSKYQLQVTGTKSKVKWTSSNKAVATVTSNGLVAAKKAGTATIIATIGSKKYTCKVLIKKGSVKLNKTALKLDLNESETLKLTGTKDKIYWRTSNASVAVVSKSGKVTVQGEGIATITAQVNDNKYTCKVTIKKAVTYEIVDTEDDSIIVVKNITSYGAKIEVYMSYFDKKGREVFGYSTDLNNIGAGKKSVIVFSKPIDEATNKPVENLKLGIISFISQTEDNSSYVMTDKVNAGVNKFNDNEADFSLTSTKLKGDYFISGYVVFYKGDKIAAVTPFSCYEAKFGKSESYDLSVLLSDNNNYYYNPVKRIDKVEVMIACISPY